jgi:hypothetical protein
MPEERHISNRRDTTTKNTENSQKKGNAREFNSQQRAEPGHKGSKYERGNEIQEYEEDQEADVRGG